MSNQPDDKGPMPECRHGYECKRPDCWFQHPEGRHIDQTAPQQFFAAAPSAGYNYEQSYYAGIVPGEPVFYSDMTYPPQAPDALPTWMGPAAPFQGGYAGYEPMQGSIERLSSNGEDIDFELEAELLELRDVWIPTSAKCECCHGRVYDCSGEVCGDLGMCFCYSAFLSDQERGPAWAEVSSTASSGAAKESSAGKADVSQVTEGVKRL